MYIYAGEDLPEAEKAQEEPKTRKKPDKPPAQVKVVQPFEIKARNDELKALLKDRKKTMDDYKAIAGERTVATMDQKEYDLLLSELIEAWS